MLSFLLLALSFTITHATGASGRFIRIVANPLNGLSNQLDEVLVYAGNTVNIALNKVTTSTSLYDGCCNGYSAEAAVDGNTYHWSQSGSPASACNNNGGGFYINRASGLTIDYWEVDLGTSYSITSIVVWPRCDSPAAANGNFVILYAADHTTVAW